MARRLAAIALLLLVAPLAAVPAHATFPGTNGRIAFAEAFTGDIDDPGTPTSALSIAARPGTPTCHGARDSSSSAIRARRGAAPSTTSSPAPTHPTAGTSCSTAA